MSSRSSRPMLRRTSSGSTPAASSAASESWRCVVEAGWMTSVRVSPTLARCEHRSTASMNASPAGAPAREPEREHRAGAARQVALRERVARVVGQGGVADPAHPRVGDEPLGDPAGVGDVGLHAQRQRLDPVQEQERVEGGEDPAEVAQALDAQLRAEAVLAEVVPEAQVAVRRHRLGHQREVAVVPREAPGVEHDAADRRPVTAEELRRRVQDDVDAVVHRPAQVRRGTAWRRRRAGRPRRVPRRPARRGRRRSPRGWR